VPRLGLPVERIDVTIGTHAGQPDWVMTATNAERILVNPELLAHPSYRNELHLGWRLHTALAEHVLWRQGIPSDWQLGTFLVEMAAEAFARLCVSPDGAEASFGPPAPQHAGDVNAIAGNVGAAIAGSQLARRQAGDFLGRAQPDDPIIELARGLLAVDLRWTHAEEPLPATLEIWRGTISGNA
jgi:hypothetical protein